LLRRALPLVLVLPSGCLENLHQEKYFAKLRAADPALADRVTDCRADIERQLDAAIAAEVDGPIASIGHWGESWGYVNTVVRDGVLFMRGRIRYDDRAAGRYGFAFRVGDDCTIEIVEREVHG